MTLFDQNMARYGQTGSRVPDAGVQGTRCLGPGYPDARVQGTRMPGYPDARVQVQGRLQGLVQVQGRLQGLVQGPVHGRVRYMAGSGTGSDTAS